uniref:Uncharacterized protein LOC114344997 n=1 Tax=Diabrotica virgifera virgifera TaxID=50390 RepID=A0A6P7GNY8_DIAVI
MKYIVKDYGGVKLQNLTWMSSPRYHPTSYKGLPRTGCQAQYTIQHLTRGCPGLDVKPKIPSNILQGTAPHWMSSPRNHPSYKGLPSIACQAQDTIQHLTRGCPVLDVKPKLPSNLLYRGAQHSFQLK